jgi:hypothetical protein
MLTTADCAIHGLQLHRCAECFPVPPSAPPLGAPTQGPPYFDRLDWWCQALRGAAANKATFHGLTPRESEDLAGEIATALRLARAVSPVAGAAGGDHVGHQLQPWLSHHPGCLITARGYGRGVECTCGLSDALAAREVG